MQKPSNTKTVMYFPPKRKYGVMPKESIEPIGIDTEAYDTGECMMICTSLGDVFHPEEWPDCMFSRKYRDRPYVAYNLKYDMGELIQHLSKEALTHLRATGRCAEGLYKYRVITNKLLAISKGKHYITIYDIMQYYGGSLDANAEKYLGDKKIDVGTKRFSREYVQANWKSISEYCIHDAELCGRLAGRLIQQLESWGMHVRKLYSTAWVSYSWFASKCGHPSCKAFWLYDRKVLDFAMQAYAGGKFEVTTKGAGNLYEYDIVSAYPSTIAQLVDLTRCGVIWGHKYHKEAVYGFIDCTLKIPANVPSPVAVKRGTRNTFPVGEFRKTITKVEYEYLIEAGADITIHDSCWIIPDTLVYPYKEEIARLVKLKGEYKHGDALAYHTIKIILNSLYGKFIQLVETDGGKWRAGSSWNPIYGAEITAQTRVRISNYQRLFSSVWAVHTDSIISDCPLPFPKSSVFGDLSYETEGPGILVACGVYEIGGKTAIRGVPSKVTLRNLAERGGRVADVSSMQPISWRQTLQRHYSKEEINRFSMQLKRLRPNMDEKRIWLDDWGDWSDVLKHNVMSVPYAVF